jgi:hypothetical protein
LKKEDKQTEIIKGNQDKVERGGEDIEKAKSDVEVGDSKKEENKNTSDEKSNIVPNNNENPIK